ncbi:hypothetical protein TWF281_000089 [Arthrobotrys megalospora]
MEPKTTDHTTGAAASRWDIRLHDSNSKPSILEYITSTLSGASAVPLKLHIPSKDEVDTAEEHGNFGPAQVSDLFLQIYWNILKSPEYGAPAGQGPMVGVTGRIPLTIISTVPDIADHYYKLIVEAKSEVMIFSNFWKFSYAARRIGDALRVLSERLGLAEEPCVHVRIMFDRGSIKHLFYSRVTVTEAEWITLGLPPTKEIPKIHLEVLNYHNFPLGTLHSKFMVVDKRIAVLNSCNIQDNSNLEMMCQFEGPIVDDIWDHAMSTWGQTVELGLSSPTEDISPSTSPTVQRSDEVDSLSADDPPIRLTANDVTEVLNRSVSNRILPDATDGDITERPFRSHIRLTTEDLPMALVPRAPYAWLGNNSLNTPQNVAWLSGIRFAKFKIFIQTPDLNASPVVTALLDAVRRGVEVSIVLCLGYNDLGEMLPMQGGHNESVVAGMKRELSEKEREMLKIYWYVGRDMTRPVHASKHFRTCHIKLMIVDDRIGIMGSGNQDTQSWFHSQEINIMVDSEEVCRGWMKQLVGNQNSFVYGQGSEVDGVWRDLDGEQAPGSIGPETGVQAWVRGIGTFVLSKLWN